MDPHPHQPPTARTSTIDDAAFTAALAAVSADQWMDLWVAVDAVAAERIHVTWSSGAVTDILAVDGVERPVLQMRYPMYSEAMERLLVLLDGLGLVVPFDWVEWDGLDRYGCGVGLDIAPVADAVRMITAIVRSERFCDGAIDRAWSDGSLPAALARLRSR